MRIAVCLSGQYRSFRVAAPSILRYFSNSAYTVDYFCHVWNYNTWKIRETLQGGPEEIVPPEDIEYITEMLQPKRLQVGYRTDVSRFEEGGWYMWGSLFYSFMAANQLKRMYEIENDFVYDWVVKTRYDLGFSPEKRFYPKVPHEERMICFPFVARMYEEYRRINMSDMLFYGDSWGMDIASDIYRSILAWKNPSEFDFDDNRGPGVLLGNYLYENNVIIRQCEFEETIIRREAMGLSINSDWHKIEAISNSYYSGIIHHDNDSVIRP